MTYSQRIALSLAFTVSVALAGTSFAGRTTETSKVGKDQTIPPAAVETAAGYPAASKTVKKPEAA